MSDPEVQAKTSTSHNEKIEAEITAYLGKLQIAQAAAVEARQDATKAGDEDEQKVLLEHAVAQEKIAAKLTKTINRLRSGLWQGGVGGAGIGATVGIGIGAGVGSLVGGVISIPTTGLGALAGVATGAVHGPWFGNKQKDELKDEENGEIALTKDKTS